jgi:RNA polymerase sigma-70 factor (ECF subfamily)
MTTAATYANLRSLIFSIAYRMLGSAVEAEDIVQDAFLRYHRAVADGTVVESPKAFLSAVTTRLSIDHLRSAKVRRESYVGVWLPEPLLTDRHSPDPAGLAEAADSLSMAFLLVLERLNPVERAVFLLRDVFDYPYEEIADIVDKTEANCRQIAARARRHVAVERRRFNPPADESADLAATFCAALAEGDLDQLVALLVEDVVVYGDSGGTRPSWPKPITGQAAVARLLAGLGASISAIGLSMRPAEVNGGPGAVVRDATGGLVNVFSLEVEHGKIGVVRSVINPAKLRHLGELADREPLIEALRRTRV